MGVKKTSSGCLTPLPTSGYEMSRELSSYPSDELPPFRLPLFVRIHSGRGVCGRLIRLTLPPPTRASGTFTTSALALFAVHDPLVQRDDRRNRAPSVPLKLAERATVSSSTSAKIYSESRFIRPHRHTVIYNGTLPANRTPGFSRTPREETESVKTTDPRCSHRPVESVCSQDIY